VSKARFIILSALILAILGLGTFDRGPSSAQAATDTKSKTSLKADAQAAIFERQPNKMKRPTLDELKAAAARAKALRDSVSGSSAVALPVPPPGGTPDYYGIYSNYANSPLPVITRDPVSGTITAITGGMRKFVDSLPGVGPAQANNLGQYIPVATPDTTTYPGCDYYEIAQVEFRERMHSDLPATGVRLRGYVQEVGGVPVGTPHYLGPMIVAQKNRPVRVKFTTRLPIGAGGDLFIPVDTTLMGAGTGPNGGTEMYTQNRTSTHLHGGTTPWISDGTPHQWITPAGESTSYPKGVSVQNVPDMPNPGPGAMTFFYSNQQSARLMFYHDHAFGITRLNVYVGMAAAYLIQDTVEQGLVSSGIIPPDQIPLVLQDKTFVPDNTRPFTNLLGTFASQLEAQDPTWDTTKYGGFGELWYPHVYIPYQNPADISGVSPVGRWHYSAWFFPPFIPLHPPVPNPYYDPVNAPWEPPMIPGTPNPSVVAEGFLDTPVINGTAYPYVVLQPKAYRFRILNAANDRFFNLQLYVADPAVTTIDGRANTEVKMVPAVPTAGYPASWPTDGRIGGVPDPTTQGPPWIQIGTEGGFLPAPVVIPPQPVDWNTDMGTFDFGNVDTYSLFIGSAERADVIVDFSQYAGKTLILYNDSPAAVPAGDPRYDYFTDSPDQSDVGGAPSTPAGWGPNIRTIMQIRVAAGVPAAPFNLTALQNAFATTGSTPGAFAAQQKQIIVPGDSYNSAYNMTFPPDPYVRIGDTSITFTPIGATAPVTLPLEPKAIHDEMGGTFDPEYGRMSARLGLSLPFTVGNAQTFLMYEFVHPPVELIVPSIYGSPIGVLGDGTQIWKISQNGVDTHAVHFHVFDVQLINRVAWDNNVRPPDANELGWKDTVKINPLQDTIVALRPIAPVVPFKIPNSIRPLAPNLPLGTVLDGVPATADPQGNPVTVLNHLVNFGWEYVWHCHLLAHEENDMMHGIAIGIAPEAPTNLQAVYTANAVTLTWTDNSLSETGFTIQRATDAGFTAGVLNLTVGTNVTAYIDSTVNSSSTYYYHVMANNMIGDTTAYPAPAVGFPHWSVDSAFSNSATITTGTIIPPNAGTGQHAAGDFDGNGIRDFAADFGPNGLWLWSGGAWSQMSPYNPETLVSVDLNADGQDEVIADFGPIGLWQSNGGLWTQLSGVDAESLAAGNVDVDPAGELVAEFGAIGVWLLNGGAWTQLSGVNPDSLLVADVTGTAAGEIIGDFAATGLWMWSGGVWTQLSGLNVENIAAGGKPVGGYLVGDFGTIGLWKWDATWTQLTGVNPDSVITADTNGNLTDEVVGDFGALGLWSYDLGAWTQLTGSDADSVIRCDINADGIDEIAGDFGALGIWLLSGGTWNQIDTQNPELILASDVDGDGADEILADRGTNGLWMWNNNTWSQLTAMNLE
jgi:FtsP/CotA-like multicopper oxidase with cupredoxin domain